MPYCPNCRAEYDEGYTTCADCHVPLVEEPPVQKPRSIPASKQPPSTEIILSKKELQTIRTTWIWCIISVTGLAALTIINFYDLFYFLFTGLFSFGSLVSLVSWFLPMILYVFYLYAKTQRKKKITILLCISFFIRFSFLIPSSPGLFSIEWLLGLDGQMEYMAFILLSEVNVICTLVLYLIAILAINGYWYPPILSTLLFGSWIALSIADIIGIFILTYMFTGSITAYDILGAFLYYGILSLVFHVPLYYSLKKTNDPAFVKYFILNNPKEVFKRGDTGTAH